MVYDKNNKPISIGMKLKRICGRHGIVSPGDIIKVRGITDTGIKIEGDLVSTYDPKYFIIISSTKSYLPSWL
jgi:hypothetical protein